MLPINQIQLEVHPGRLLGQTAQRRLGGNLEGQMEAFQHIVEQQDQELLDLQL